MRPDGLIERPPTGHQTRSVHDGKKLRTYHNINGMWGEKLWCEGEWAIYKPEFKAGSSMCATQYNCVLIHSKIWIEKKIVHHEPKTCSYWREGAEVVKPHYETEDIELVCHTQLFPKHITECMTCRSVIPEGAIALWKLLNSDALSEETQ